MPKKTYKRRADGRYALYRDRKPFYGNTIAEAEAARMQYDLEKAQGLDTEKTNILVSEYAEQWLPIHRANSCNASYKMYGKMLDRFIAFVGDPKIRNVKKSDVVAFYNSLNGYSRSHLNKFKDTIGGMFASAKEDGIIARNPALDAKTPKGTDGVLQHRPLEDWERELVHKMVDYEYRANGETRHGHPFAFAAMVMLYQGLRKEEALALDIDRDVDFVNNRLYVRNALSYSDTIRGKLKDPKTNKGMRSMPLFAPVRVVLEGKHGPLVKPIKSDQMTLSAFARMWNSYKYHMGILHSGVRPRWDAGGAFEPITIRTHDFRHSFCTMICDAGVDIKTAMIWMGHTDEKMIRQIYDHATAKRLQIAEQNTAKTIEKMWSNSQNDSQKKIEDPEIIEI